MSVLLRDLRHGLRSLAKSPAFTAAAVVSLALGIGANAALFSLFNSLLWRPLPVADADRLAVLYSRLEGQIFSEGFSYPEYRDYREQLRVFTDLVAYTPVEVALGTERGENVRAFGEAVSANYFRMLGVRPALGRTFTPDEEGAAGARPVVVLSHLFWQRQFGGDPGVVGQTIRVSGHTFTVVGVAPRRFHGTYAVFFAPNFWIPAGTIPQISLTRSGFLESRRARGVRLLGRLRPGASFSEAQAAASTVAARLAEAYPDINKGRVTDVYPELATRPEVEVARAVNVVAVIFLALTSLVLLVACANVANLLLARSAARRREIAMRLALGATRGRLVRQLLTESALLALGAGGLGLGLSVVASRLAQSLRLPTDIPLNLEVQTDWRVVLFTFVVAAAASVAFGLVPALQASRPSLVPALKGEGPTMSSSRRGFSLRNALVVAQVTVSLVLLVAAGLFVRSVSGARTIDPGFEVDDRVVLSFNPTLVGYDADRIETFYRRLLDRVRLAPGIEHATLAGPVPLDFGIGTDEVVIEGRAVDEGQEAEQVLDAVVEADYFRTMGTRLVAGRPFTAIDTPAVPGVVIVNETMARRFWPGLDPIGRRLRIRGQGEESRVVVGVVADGKYRQLTEAPRPFMLLPLSQNPQSSLTLVVHSRRDAGSVIAAARREALALDPTMPVFEAKSMAQHMERAYLAPRLSAWLIGPAGILALAIAAVGLAGVMAYSVSQRTRELGIRVAVGASPASVMALVMRQGLTLAAVGVALGLIGALALSRVVSNLLFGVSPRDPITFAGVALALLLVSAVATYLPARRALAIDPLAAFRAE